MLRLLVICLLLSINAPAAAAARAVGGDWDVRVTPFDQVFPALELSQMPRNGVPRRDLFGDGNGLIAVRVRSRHAGERVHLRVQASELETSADIDAELSDTRVDYELHPRLRWNTARLGGLGSPRTIVLHFTLQRDGVDSVEITRSISLRPLSEALYFVRDGRDSVDLSWIFAAYVNETDTVVDHVLDLAKKSGIVANFDGYAGDSADHVYRQVWAVWQALSAHGIRYADTDPGIARGPHEFSQHVRLLDETWSDGVANCIDGSVLIASVLQRVGLRSFLVLVPGHAFVGFYTDADATNAAYIETTLLGATPPLLRQLPHFAENVFIDTRDRGAIAGFSAALASGRARYASVASRMDGAHRPDYVLIDISAARAFGIQPIAIEPGKTRLNAPAQLNSAQTAP